MAKDKYSAENLTLKDLGRIERLMEKSGYENNKDYRVNYFENKGEVFFINEKLIKEIRSLMKLKKS